MPWARHTKSTRLLSELPSDLSRTRLLSLLERLGFAINLRGGNGSHCKVTWPKNGKSVVIPYTRKFRKTQLQYILEDIEAVSGLKWSEIRDK